MSNISSYRKKRGVVRACKTKLRNRLEVLEGETDYEQVNCHVQRLYTRLGSLDEEFKAMHFQLIDAIDEQDTDTMAAEQDVIDKHDDDVDSLSVRIQQLLSATKSPTVSKEQDLLRRKLCHLEESLKVTHTAINELPHDIDDLALIQTHEEELSTHKEQLMSCRDGLSIIDLREGDPMLRTYSELAKLHFDCCHKIKGMLNGQYTSSASIPPAAEEGNVKVPKLDAPTFDGNILNWKQFWEQFAISIDGNVRLTDAEKFVYLQNSLKGGPAKNVIEGLSGTGEHYAKAVECLKSRYDWPRLIHQTQVKNNMEASPLKEGSGRELRRLHDVLQQHLRAIDATKSEPLSQFITSLVQLKLDSNTTFEWQKHTQNMHEVPNYQSLLEFIDLRAIASESSSGNNKRITSHHSNTKPVTSFVANSESSSIHCPICKTERHPLYLCHKFKELSHENKLSAVRGANICINCLRPGHMAKECKSSHRCRNCQKLHHALLHIEAKNGSPHSSTVSSNTATGVIPDTLLMTCQVLVTAPDGSRVKVRDLFDSASSASFVSERIAQSLCLPRSHHQITISGIAGLSNHSPLRSIATLNISSALNPEKQLSVRAIVVPQVTCDLPVHPVKYKTSWTHLSGLAFADPEFGRPGKIDLLLGVEVYADIMLLGRRSGSFESPTAFETSFGWVLSGKTESAVSSQVCVTSHVSTTTNDDDILRKFWEIEEQTAGEAPLTVEEQEVMKHFAKNHYQTEDGRFVVSLPKRSGIESFGESRSQAVRRFMYLERSLHRKNQHEQFNAVMQEYIDLGHAESIPCEELECPETDIFYLPLHVVHKESSTTTKVRAVFDASAKSASGVSLNDCVLVGPTVHPLLVDVLLRFRFKRVALITDVSKMYRAIELVKSERDWHRLSGEQVPLKLLRIIE